MKTIIGIMGPGEEASDFDCKNAYKIGSYSAQKNYIVLTGGRAAGVMEAALKGAKDSGGTTIGIIPSKNPEEKSFYVDLPIVTGMGGARNYINALSSHVMVACGLNAGTLTEISFAVANKRKVILITNDVNASFLLSLFGKENFSIVSNPDLAIQEIETSLGRNEQ